jgi:hypothetical protein
MIGWIREISNRFRWSVIKHKDTVAIVSLIAVGFWVYSVLLLHAMSENNINFISIILLSLASLLISCTINKRSIKDLKIKVGENNQLISENNQLIRSI